MRMLCAAVALLHARERRPRKISFVREQLAMMRPPREERSVADKLRERFAWSTLRHIRLRRCDLRMRPSVRE
jgi:hypothetical protein